MIIEVFPYIILFDFCPNAKSAKFYNTPNFVDLQYIKSGAVLKIVPRFEKRYYFHSSEKPFGGNVASEEAK